MSRFYLDTGHVAQNAEYNRVGLIDEAQGNPLLEALPPWVSQDDIIRKLGHYPPFRAGEREVPPEVRMQLVQRLFGLFQPLPIHLEVWSLIQRLLWQGYVARNPFSKDYVRFVNSTGKQILNRTYTLESQEFFRSTASVGTLVGVSGMGKTTTVNRVLAHTPQIVVHHEYQGMIFSQIQVTWLKLEIPHNSSLKALCLQFFLKLDEMLGTNNFKKHVSRNLSVDAMVPLMAQVSQNVKLGLLVLDEVQNIQHRGNQRMLDFFVSLTNQIGLPILMVGTPASLPLFDGAFRMARRLTGSGEILWSPMKKDKEFRMVLEALWRYQWTADSVELSEGWVDLFHDATQGVLDLVVKLFIEAQTDALMRQKPALRVERVASVAKSRFRLLQPMLDAMRSGNPYKMAKFEDVRIGDDVISVQSAQKVESEEGSKRGRKSATHNADTDRLGVRTTPEKGTNEKRAVTNSDAREKALRDSEVPLTANEERYMPDSKKANSRQPPAAATSPSHRRVVYEENDIRRLYALLRDGETLPDLLLARHGFLDDMTMWEDE